MNKSIVGTIIIIIILVAGLAIFSYSQSLPAAGDNKQKVGEEKGQESAGQGPKIEVSPDYYNFGTVVYGQVAEHSFNIANRGDEPLEILRLSTSCGCTQASLAADEDKIIAPGESVSMLVTFDPAVHKDDSDLGEVMRVVYIKSNDSQRPEVEARISALVIK